VPLGPRIRVRIVGVIRSPFWLDNIGDHGGVMLTSAFFDRYRTDIMGTSASSPVFINALVRLAGGQAALPAFRADLARVTGRSDIDVWDNYVAFGGPVRKVTGYEAACLRTLGLTGWQSRMVVATQASVLAVIGLAFGIPLGLAVGRAVWRVVANSTPLAYHPPVAAWTLVLIAPVTLLAANLLAVWPGHRAARLRPRAYPPRRVIRADIAQLW
jgi:hypothetical protein